MAYIDQRAQSTIAKTVLIMQHYRWMSGSDKDTNGTSVGAALKRQFESGNNGGAHVLTASGHFHDQGCDGSRTYGCDVILTGGGGGWKAPSTVSESYFGFTAVHLTDDGGFQTVLEDNAVRIPQNSCNYLSDDMPSSKDSQLY